MVLPRARILDVAEARLLKHGPNGIVLDVAADAQVSKGGCCTTSLRRTRWSTAHPAHADSFDLAQRRLELRM
jgi:hypothetical protein